VLRSLKDLERYKASATDGDIGRVVSFLLDDERWIVRYLVVEPGSFLDARQVLISPASFRKAEWPTRQFHLALTMEKVRNSPSIDVDKPVSRQHEGDFSRYYGFPYYWRAPGLWGWGSYPDSLAAAGSDETAAGHSELSGDVHLRSSRDVSRYQIQGTDGAIGHVDDFLVDDETWEVRYLVIDTSNWWFGRKVLVAPHWASRVSWEESKVYIDMSRQKIKNGPEWNSSSGIGLEYEARLADYYGRPVHRAGSAHPEGSLPAHSGGHQANCTTRD